MKIRSVELTSRTSSADSFPTDGLPEIAFAGRSNVGKSSMINGMLGRKSLARTSSTPGRTRTIDFYLVNKQFYFVDLPGYGYAKVPVSLRRQWGRFIDAYLDGRSVLRLMVHIMDCRHGPMESDLELIEWIESVELPALYVLTKADKLSANRRNASVAAVASGLGIEKRRLVPFSAKTGLGRDMLWRVIRDTLDKSPEPARSFASNRRG